MGSEMCIRDSPRVDMLSRLGPIYAVPCVREIEEGSERDRGREREGERRQKGGQERESHITTLST